MKPTHAEMISEVIKELREPFTTREIVDAVVRKYSAIRPVNKQSLGTDIAGCCANLRSHRHLPDLPVLLVSVGRGKYRRFDPGRDMGMLNHYSDDLVKTRYNSIVCARDSIDRSKSQSWLLNSAAQELF